MSLGIYFEDGVDLVLVTLANPDLARQAVVAGGEFDHQEELFLLSDDAGLTYEDIEVTAINLPAPPPDIVVEYAPDNAGVPGVWSATLTMPNGTYATEQVFWRRVFVAEVNDAFREEGIDHQLTFTEFPA